MCVCVCVCVAFSPDQNTDVSCCGNSTAVPFFPFYRRHLLCVCVAKTSTYSCCGNSAVPFLSHPRLLVVGLATPYFYTIFSCASAAGPRSGAGRGLEGPGTGIPGDRIVSAGRNFCFCVGPGWLSSRLPACLPACGARVVQCYVVMSHP